MNRHATNSGAPQTASDSATLCRIRPTRGSLNNPETTLIRITDVMAMVGLSRPTIYKLMQRRDSGFPLPVKLSDSTARGAPVAWVLSEVQAWVRARIAARKEVAA
ncbi:AlpA family phage regulatory protein [Pseudomonas sp. 21LCFQ010]|uniref:helix-turn-helix transcriptional regulator n=1 Tax=Pseudomonas sp. 21LCFQ010 TaxID=2957506 RepID=UPI002097DB0C|nr:AlpA family phage regulatory protein [Pseudomonas sp. 21LCFQ010]MCO8165481.1 AlpA family phage regulatory protein [Pseudomonas sp. 21LCFQ010]